MSTALVSAFYDVDDVLYQVSTQILLYHWLGSGKNGKFSILADKPVAAVLERD